MGLKRRGSAWRRDSGGPNTLHPRLLEPSTLRRLQAKWVAKGGCIRIEAPLLAPNLAEAIVREMEGMTYTAFELDDPAYGTCFFWRAVYSLEDRSSLSDTVRRAADFVVRDLPWLVHQVTGWSAEIPAPVVGFTQFRQGCFLNVHNEYWDRPGLGFVVGLTRVPWPASEGAHLTFYGEDKKTVIERRPPGWDTVDLYTTHPVPRWHAVPRLDGDRIRLTLAGLMAGSPP